MTSTNQTTEVRHLYVPSAVVSWDAQMDRAVRLAHKGLAVRLHRHAWGGACTYAMSDGDTDPISPDGWCVDIELTQDGESTNVIPVSNTESETAKTD